MTTRDRVVDALSRLPGVRVAEVGDDGLLIETETAAHKADVMQVLAHLGAEHPDVSRVGAEARGAYKHDRDVAAHLLRCAHDLRWRQEHGERFALPHVTQRLRFGDCDDLVVLLVAWMLAAGLDAECVVILDDVGDGPEGTHATARVRLGGAWVWAEPSVRCWLGSDPRELRRLGGVVPSGT